MDNKVIDLTGLDTFKDKMDASVDEKIQNAYKNEVTGVKGNSESSYRTGNVNITPANIGLGNVGNYKAVSTVANQGLTDAEKSNARTNIGAGTSSFSGSYTDLTNKPTIPSVGNGTITIVQAGTTKGTFTTNQSGNTTIELSDNNTTYSVATQSANGLMSSADKQKLDGVATGAEVNQNAFSNVVVGSTTISADSKTDSLTLAGSNVTITPDATNDKVTIGITKDNVTSALGYTPPTTNTTYGVATSSALGLVKSGTDITVDSNGNVSVNDDSHNHVISNIDGLQTALDGKAASSHTHSSYVNQNAFSNVVVGSTTVSADTPTDTLTLVAGNNVTITPDATNDKITISSVDTKYTHPTSGVTAGTYKSVTVDSNGHVTAGSNPTTLAGYGITDAAAKSHTHDDRWGSYRYYSSIRSRNQKRRLGGRSGLHKPRHSARLR